jgi:hypothetical protein
MKTQGQFEGLKNKFNFNGLSHEMDLDPLFVKRADLRLIQLLADAPPGATASGWVERSGREFIAAIRVQSAFRSFSSSAAAMDVETAVRKALERMEEELYRWRFGGDSGDESRLDRGYRGGQAWATRG